MSFAPYTMFDYRDGLVKNRQDWIIPDGAFAALFDGFVHHGVLRGREGYSPFAVGGEGGAPYCESRIVSELLEVPMNGTIDGMNATFTLTLETPVRRGTIVVEGADPAQTLTDDGLGELTGAGGSTGTIDYTTGALSVTFGTAPDTSVVVSYDFHPGLPVMMIANFTTSTNVQQMLVADTRYINRYNGSTNRLNDFTPTAAITDVTMASPAVVTSVAHELYTGQRVYIYNTGISGIDNDEYVITRLTADTFSLNGSTAASTSITGTIKKLFSGGAADFFHWDNYPNAANVNRLLFTNNVDPIQEYDGSSVFPYEFDADFDFKDNGGSVNVQNLRCLRLHFFKDRLVLLNVTWFDVNLNALREIPRGIKISGTGSSADDFNVTATGAGEINLPDQYWINSSELNGDDLLILSQKNAWSLQYTGNDIVPFVPKRIDHTRGSDAPMGTHTYLNRTVCASRRGLVITDGYQMNEYDELIPDFVFDEVDNENFNRVFAGSEDKDKHNYLIYPSTGSQSEDGESDRILIVNFEEGNICTYRIPLSCMGQFEDFFEITWQDLGQFASWTEWSAQYETWDSNAYSKNAIRTIGGGHHGEIVRLNADESVDGIVKIRGATNANPCVLTTDFNSFVVGDIVFVNAVQGMSGLNGVLSQVQARTDNSVTLSEIDTTSTSTWGTYTEGGEIFRIIPFEATTKKFNPFFNTGQGVRVGWMYLYFSTTDSQSFGQFVSISNVSISAEGVVTVTTSSPCNLTTGDEVFIRGITGTTELNEEYFSTTANSSTQFTLNGIDGTSYTPYVSGGVVKSRNVAKIFVDVLANDTEQLSQGQAWAGTSLGIVLSNREGVTQEKMWKKFYIGQSGNFVQFRIRNSDYLTNIRIHAMILGLAPRGGLRDA